MSIRRGILRVRRHDAGSLLVELLAGQAASDPGASRQANDLVRGGRVQIDGNICSDPTYVLRAGEVVKVLEHAASPAARQEDVRLVYADDHVVVIEKPPGVTSMREGSGERKRPGKQATLDQMVGRLLAKGRKDRRRSVPPVRGQTVIPVHRLDRDTSGLMVFARTRQAQHALEAQFKARDVGRSYLAVVHGRPHEMTITTHTVRDRGDGLRGSAEVWGKDPAAGQRAVTHIEPQKELGDYSLVRCTLETGRTHQIRIHLSEIGHMLCGEKEYVRRPDGTRMRDGSGAPRQALHAERLWFTHPASGREMKFVSKLPADLARWLEMLRTRIRRSARPHRGE